MNKAIQLSKGEWLYFIGADDIIHEGAITHFFQALPGYHGNFIFGNYYETSNNQIIKTCHQQPYSFKWQLLKGCLNHQSVFIKRSLFEKYGNYNTAYPFCADYEFYLRIPFSILKMAKKIDFPIAYYNKTGASSIAKEQVYKERKSIINKYFGKLVGGLYSFYLKLSNA
jgi:glycosyltransferase involved in cell wall biosynthesis